VDLIGWARPVLRREAVERQVGNAELDGCAHSAPHGLDAIAMADSARQAMLAGPAPIAVHDDGDVLRLSAIALVRCRLCLDFRHRRQTSDLRAHCEGRAAERIAELAPPSKKASDLL